MSEDIEKLIKENYLEKFVWWDNLPLNWKQIFINNIEGKKLFEIFLDDIYTYSLNIFSGGSVLFTLYRSSKKYPLSGNCVPFKVYGELEMINFFNKLFSLNELNLQSCSQIKCCEILDLFKYFSRLEIVNLNNTQISNLNGIEKLVNLKRLEIINTNISNLQELVNLKSLEVLKFSYKYCPHYRVRCHFIDEIQTEIDEKIYFDMSFLSDLKEIKELSLQLLYAKNFDSIQYLFNLEILDLGYSNFWELSKLRNLKRLRKLNISGIEIEDIQDLACLKNIEELDISENLEITNIKTLENFHKLKYLNLSNTAVTNLEPISRLFNLNVLILNGLRNRNFETHFDGCNEINFSDYSEEEYEIFFSWTLNLNPIRQLQNLKELYISNTDVSDFNVLSELFNLEVLDMSGLYIDNLKFIFNLKNLKRLIIKDVTGLKIADVDEAKHNNHNIQIEFSLIEEDLDLFPL